MYIHMEADMAIPWSALTPWATDTALLTEHGFHRGFFVVEHSVEEGEAVMVNELQPVSSSQCLACLSHCRQARYFCRHMTGFLKPMHIAPLPLECQGLS